jgi:hypothetical protein
LLWLRSYWEFDTVTLYLEPGITSPALELGSAHGILFAGFAPSVAKLDPGTANQIIRVSHSGANLVTLQLWKAMPPRGLAPFSLVHVRPILVGWRLYGHEVYGIKLAVWVIVVGLGSWWLYRKLRRGAQLRTGRCLTCGYDLRATPDHCPECGWHADVPSKQVPS